MAFENTILSLYQCQENGYLICETNSKEALNIDISSYRDRNVGEKEKEKWIRTKTSKER